MQHPLQYPLTLNFKIAALAPQISVTDASGREILYVRQKLLKLRDKIKVFADSSQSQELYEINADRILDWSAANFAFTDPQGRTVGSVQRQGLRSFWRATYEIQAPRAGLYTIVEEQPWLKVIDRYVEDIPIVGMFSGHAVQPHLRRPEQRHRADRPADHQAAGPSCRGPSRIDNLAGPPAGGRGGGDPARRR